MNAWFVQSLHLPPVLSPHRPGSHLFEHAGAYPGFPVFLLTNRVGKTSVRPRKSERNSWILSAGVCGVLLFVASGRRIDTGAGAGAISSSARSEASRTRASSCMRSSSVRRASSRAMSCRISVRSRVMARSAAQATPDPRPADPGWAPHTIEGAVYAAPGAMLARRDQRPYSHHAIVSKMPAVHDMRLGHALRGGADAVQEAVDIVRGARPLLPRQPSDPAAVDAAESVLGISPDARPIYAYLGDLHPGLGTVGLVIERSWLQTLTGVTRCDSGGLVGRRGAFTVLTDGEAISALRTLTFTGESLRDWEPAFGPEIGTSYHHGASGYVNGDEPDVSTWQDPRGRCFEQATPPRDRRLWTWEVRLGQSPNSGDVVALALSRSAAAVLEELHRQGVDVPSTVRVLYGSISSAGSQFHEPSVRSLLAGEA